MRRRDRMGLVILTAALVLSGAKVEAGRIAAQMPWTWDTLNPSDWISVDDSTASRHGAVMLFDKVTVDDAAKSGLTVLVTIYRRIRIVSALGHSAADISVPQFYRAQKVKAIVGRTIRRDGDTVALQPEQIIEKETFKSQDVKIKSVSFSMPGVSDDCIIEYCIRLELPYAYRNWLIQRNIPLLHGSLDWKLSTGGSKSAVDLGYFQLNLVPNWVALNLSRKVRVEKLPSIKDTREIVFNVDSVPALEDEQYALPDKAVAGQLRLYYGSSASPEAYWAEFASAVPRWADAYLDKTPETKKTAVLFDYLSTTQEKIDSAYAWVQHRFKNMTYMKTEDTASLRIKHVTARDAFKRGYADREGINYIFYDILREMNIDAKIAWVEDRDEDIFVPEVKTWQFDRQIVAVPNLEKNYVYYSPGDQLMPSGSVAWYNEGVSALIGGSTASSFVAIPFSRSSDNRINRSVTLELGEDLEPSATVSEQRSGHSARRYRITIREAAESEKTDVIKNKLKDLFGEAEIDSVTYENGDSAQLPLKLAYRLRFPSLEGSTSDNRLLLKPMEFLEKAVNPFVTNERQNAIVMNYTYETHEALTISMPQGWGVVGLPPDALIANEFGTCGVRFVEASGAVMVQRTLSVKMPFLPAAEYALAQELFQGYVDLSGLTLTLERKSD